jgi:hypothetical protein
MYFYHLSQSPAPAISIVLSLSVSMHVYSLFELPAGSMGPTRPVNTNVYPRLRWLHSWGWKAIVHRETSSAIANSLLRANVSPEVYRSLLPVV